MQCMRCQLYGHTKSCCNRPCVCVKCGGQHSTESCKKDKTTPATCSLCGGDHPTNYKGCDYYQSLITQSMQTTDLLSHNVMHHPSSHNNPRPQGRTYAQTQRIEGLTPAVPNVEEPMSPTQFLGKFKVVFNQLIQQSNMFLNMLTMLLKELNIG